MSKGQFVGKEFHFIIMLALGVLIGAPLAYAQCIAGVPCVTTAQSGQTAAMSPSRACDANFMNQITARASLEAQREMIINQHYIAKADSVLEYSCFDKMISSAADTLPGIFSTSDNWDGHSVILTGGITMPKSVKMKVNMGEGHGDDVFESTILKPIKKYIDNNFGHSFLGGKIGIDSNVSGSLSGGASACSHMATIWHVAKCDDMTTNPFTDFEALTGNDPRIHPSSCGGTDIDPGVIQVARNAAPDFAYAAVDKVKTHFDLLKAPDTGLSPACGAPLPTGVVFPKTISQSVGADNVATRQVKWQKEFICPNPSCNYVGGGCVQ